MQTLLQVSSHSNELGMDIYFPITWLHIPFYGTGLDKVSNYVNLSTNTLLDLAV